MAVGSLRVLFDGQTTEVPLAFSWATHTDVAVLVANVSQTFTVPQRANMLLLNSTADFYIVLNGTATVPSASITNGTGPELSPRGKVVLVGDSISVVAAAATTVTLSYFQ